MLTLMNITQTLRYPKSLSLPIPVLCQPVILPTYKRALVKQM